MLTLINSVLQTSSCLAQPCPSARSHSTSRASSLEALLEVVLVVASLAEATSVAVAISAVEEVEPPEEDVAISVEVVAVAVASLQEVSLESYNLETELTV